jgi:hypothetical protein
MGLVDSITGWIDDIRKAHRERKRARRRRREAGVRPGDKARDGLTDGLLRVVNISDKRASEYTVDGVPLPEYGRNTALDCDTDVVVECRSPNGNGVCAYPGSRIYPLEISAGDYARDRFTGDVLTVKRIRDTVAGDWSIDGTPLSDYNDNRKLDCADDWVVDCTYYYSRNSKAYQFPLSRLAPGKYATKATEWKERVRNSKTCFSCRDGRKGSERQSACHNCRNRLFARDGRTCQQKGCSDTDDLVVHHLWYQPNPVTGTIPDSHLIVLCDDHHRQRHGIDDSAD